MQIIWHNGHRKVKVSDRERSRWDTSLNDIEALLRSVANDGGVDIVMELRGMIDEACKDSLPGSKEASDEPPPAAGRLFDEEGEAVANNPDPPIGECDGRLTMEEAQKILDDASAVPPASYVAPVKKDIGEIGTPVPKPSRSGTAAKK